MDAEAPADTLERILRTAVASFAQRGYQRTSLRLIAEQLGLTKAASWHHFPAKADILSAWLFSRWSMTSTPTLRSAAQLDPTWGARAAIEGWVDATP